MHLFFRRVQVSEFKHGNYEILLATDVSARGLGKF